MQRKHTVQPVVASTLLYLQLFVIQILNDMSVLGVGIHQINFPKKCDLYSSATYMCFVFFTMHFMAGATCIPELLIVWKMRYLQFANKNKKI